MQITLPFTLPDDNFLFLLYGGTGENSSSKMHKMIRLSLAV
ncbi:hypothetical protein CLOSTMETH_03638 [[Clostridium] methylpentosum DSM 5476]|uniref:Uncharacterized protein n=1 Tax=[Clostridium] methylpentosum DSM 5476 TaxID=537013 RepID=C0EIE2_9FIRM|nr:hypothetical protein CLOSTMETH_03638 [[Clostridium] methylpentosum DSM 5476]